MATSDAELNIASELYSTETIRQRATNVLLAVENGHSGSFTINRDALPAACELVIDVTRRHYPDLRVPYHSRWRHFEFEGTDLSQASLTESSDRLASEIELVVISVLLDAGAGKDLSLIHI